MILLLQIIFVLFFLIAVSGSIPNLLKGPAVLQSSGKEIPPALDNMYRFMAGIYLGVGAICLWVALTMDIQGSLVYLVSLTVFLAGTGRIISIRAKGAPNLRFYFYAATEIVLPIVTSTLQYLRGN